MKKPRPRKVTAVASSQITGALKRKLFHFQFRSHIHSPGPVRYRIASRQALNDPWEVSAGAQILDMSQAVQIFNAEETRAKHSEGLRCREDSTTLASPHEFRCLGDSR